MNKVHLRFIPLLIIFSLLVTSCRKDNSGFIIPGQQGTTSKNCQIVSYATEDKSNTANYKYELDSIITEIITTEDGLVDDAWYLKIENPKQLLVFHQNKNPESAVSRIYLNQEGSIEREVKVTLNNDGTYKEVRESINTFIYNSKKQLTKIDINMDAGEVSKGSANFTYDDQNRIKKIAFLDEFNKEVFIYDNFTYDAQIKKDNYLSLDLFESPTSYFIPSLRNVYIKGYKASFPESDLFTSVFNYSYTFSEGKLSEVNMKVQVFGVDQQVKLKVGLQCK